MHRRLLKALPGMLAAAALAPLVTCGTAQAIPAFARQVKTECSSCHTVFPELTEAGANFKKNGFVWNQTAVKSAGKEGKEYLLLSSIPEYVPVSISGTLDASYDNRRGKDFGNSGDKFDFVPRAIRLQAGGNLGEKVAFWLSYNLYTSNDAFDNTVSNTTTNNTPNIVEAYAMGRRLYGTPINFKVGRFQPGVSLWEKNDKTTIAEYSTTHAAIGNSLFSLDDPADGAEINAVALPRVFFALGGFKRKEVSNGDGYVSARYKFGGTDFNGGEAEVNLEGEETFLNYLTATIGGFGYLGTNEVGNLKQINHFYRAGGEGDINYKRLRVKLASAFGEDKNALTANPGVVVNSKIYSAEASYLVNKTLIPAFRFELVDQEQVALTRNYITAVNYAPLENVKFVAEAKVSDTSGKNATVYNLALVGAF